MRQNLLSGTIPSTWLVPGAMPQLQNMYLDSNMLSGTLSSDWAQEVSPLLSLLQLSEAQPCLLLAALASTTSAWLQVGLSPHVLVLPLRSALC